MSVSSAKGTYAASAQVRRVLAAVFVTALAVVLVPAVNAPAAPEPALGGTTTLTFEKLKKVKPQAISPATANGSAITLNNATGTADPARGSVNLTLSGGVRLKGKGAKADLTAIKVLAGGVGSITAQLNGKVIELATTSGPAESSPSGVALSNVTATLTSDGAKALNKVLAKKKKKGKAAASKKKGGKPFKAGNRLAAISANVPIEMVDVRAEGSFVLESAAANALTFFGKGVNALTGGITPVPPASGGVPSPFSFPVTGGRVSPDLSSGQITSAGGLLIVKNQTTPPGGACTIPLGVFIRESSLVVDLERNALLATVEAQSGTLGTGIVAANLDMSEATKSVSPSGAVKIEDMQPRITDISATTLNFIFGSAAAGCGTDFTGGTSLGRLSVTTQLG